MQRLMGKIAVVTGASRGVGRGIALVLGEEGATVYVTARSIKEASTRPYLPGTTVDDTAEQINDRGGVGIPVQCDHTVQAQIEALFERVKQEQSHLDILVNNAWGGYEEEEGRHKSGSPFWEWSIGHWNKAFAAGVWSTMVTSYFAVPLMLRQCEGFIANTTLDVSEYDGGWLFYYTPKSTINRMTFGMAVDLREHNVAVMGVAPGWSRTEAVMSGRPGHTLPVGDDLKMTESVEYVGRAVVALATDSNVMDKTGRILHTRDLGREYGFSDIDGSDPLFYEGCEGWSATGYK
jgi:NAD(P)-dependent dehydrogenase (short-subunit alcohol dehydrogenase family)